MLEKNRSLLEQLGQRYNVLDGGSLGHLTERGEWTPNDIQPPTVAGANDMEMERSP